MTSGSACASGWEAVGEWGGELGEDLPSDLRRGLDDCGDLALSADIELSCIWSCELSTGDV